jgi:hypothetical protein
MNELTLAADTLGERSISCDACAKWEHRLEHRGMAIWESLAREG